MKKLLILFTVFFITSVNLFSQTMPDIHPNKRVDNPRICDNHHKKIERHHNREASGEKGHHRMKGSRTDHQRKEHLNRRGMRPHGR